MLERRPQFSRHNILHLWDWICSDLIKLGANGAEILGKSFFHVGTRNLQVRCAARWRRSTERNDHNHATHTRRLLARPSPFVFP